MAKYIACTTFPDQAWDIYAKNMIKSFAKHWHGTPLMVNLDTPALQGQVAELLRKDDRVVAGYSEEVGKWLDARHEKDEGINDYRQHCAKFAHKIFTIQRVLEAANQVPQLADYVVWVDADVITYNDVTPDVLDMWSPSDSELISYMGRKDWNHSECGFMIFKNDSQSLGFINHMCKIYLNGEIDTLPEKHDSYLFDYVRNLYSTFTGKNLTDGISGRDVFDDSQMARYMTHYKGNRKADIANPPADKPKRANLDLRPQNCVPDDHIKENVKTNRWLIKDWLKQGKPSKKRVIMCAAGPSLALYIDEIKTWQKKGHVIVAVKHAIGILQKYGVEPDYIVLLDPRAHVEQFVETPSAKPTYLVASMVMPEVVISLYKAGCRVIGYHASVGAGEHEVLEKYDMLVMGGTAAATRALSIFEYLGYKDFELYGYDLSCWDKPDMDAKDALGGPKYIYAIQEVQDKNSGQSLFSRGFYAEPQWLVQAQELQQIAAQGKITINAHGFGIVPWMFRAGKAADNLIKGQEWKKNCQCKTLFSKLNNLLNWKSKR